MDWLAGLRAGEQPALFGMPGFAPVLVDLRQVIFDDCGDLGWELEGVTAEAKAGLAVTDGHAVAGRRTTLESGCPNISTSSGIRSVVFHRSWAVISCRRTTGS